MGKLINFNENFKKTKSNSLDKKMDSKIIPLSITNIVYSSNTTSEKPKESFRDYFERFAESIFDMNAKKEFNPNYLIHKYGFLSRQEQLGVQLDSEKFYSNNNKLTYKKFIEIVDLYISRRGDYIEPDNLNDLY